MTTLTPVPIDPELAKQLQRVRVRLDRDLQERDNLVARAVRDGGSLREVGELVGLSHTRVRQIAEAVSLE